jgi:hypothetical protein
MSPNEHLLRYFASSWGARIEDQQEVIQGQLYWRVSFSTKKAVFCFTQLSDGSPESKDKAWVGLLCTILDSGVRACEEQCDIFRLFNPDKTL